MEIPVPRADRRDEYWSWAAVALYLLLTVDLLTTIFAAATVGPEAEINPLVQWAWASGLEVLIVVNLLALVVLAILFYGLIYLTRNAPDPYAGMISLSFEIWVGLLIAAGLLIFANNLSVIILRRDIVSLLSGVF